MAQRVIDADGHICETKSLWEEYIPRAYRDRTIRIERGDDGQDRTWVNGEVRQDLLPAMACVPWGMDDPNNVPTWDDITPGSHDGAARVAVIDRKSVV